MGYCGFYGSFNPPFRLKSISSALADSLAFLGNRERRKLGHKTYMRRTDDGVAIRLYETDVILIGKGWIALSSGGWRTMHTKERLNVLMPQNLWIHADRGLWHLKVRTDGERADYHEGGRTYVFADGITIRANGHVTGAGDEAKMTKLRKEIASYASDFAKAAIAGEVHVPGNGDCWYCCMFVSNGPEKGKTLGDASKGDSHLADHMREHYFVPSLLANAAKETENRYLLTWGLPILWDETLENRAEMLQRDGKHIAEQIRRAVRKYVKRRMGLSVR